MRSLLSATKTRSARPSTYSTTGRPGDRLSNDQTEGHTRP